MVLSSLALFPYPVVEHSFSQPVTALQSDYAGGGGDGRFVGSLMNESGNYRAPAANAQSTPILTMKTFAAKNDSSSVL